MMRDVFSRIIFSGILVLIVLLGSFAYADDSEQEVGPREKLEAFVEQAKKGEAVDATEVNKVIGELGRETRRMRGDEWLEKLKLLRGKDAEVKLPTPDNPLKQDEALERLIFSMELRQLNELEPEKVQEHPTAKAFPGSVGEGAKRVTRNFVIDTDRAGWHNYGIYGNPESPYWHSTGLYAAAGEIVTVTVPADAVGKGLSVRIGSHSDGLWRVRSWRRAPDICRRFSIEKTETKAANAFGGLIYIESPYQLKDGKIEVAISNAVEAPYYVLGETDVEKWRSSIRNNPAPWGELATDKVILTLPSEDLKTVEEPEELMKFWDTIMDRYAELLGRETQRRRAERFVSDVQISAGYMHSGYPLMTMLDITEVMVDKDRIISNGHHGIWGLFHEIGHNHQNRDWTFRGTTEVTVNLFSLYVMENICGLSDDDKPHPSITAEERIKKMKKYFGDGAKFEDWQRDPFLALIMYIQLKDEFGWDAFKKTFVQYRGLGESDRPGSDDQKRDEWMVRFSKTVGRNLGPFFEKWGVPTSEEARASINELPEWMPEDFPPATEG